MEWWNYLAGGALIGVIAACWDKIKGAVWRVAKLFVQQVEITTEPAHEALVAYLIAHFPRSRFHTRVYGAGYDQFRNGRWGSIPYELYGVRTMLLWNGWRPFLFRNEVEQRANNKGSNPQTAMASDDDVQKVVSTLTFMRGWLDIDSILASAVLASNQINWAIAESEEKARNRFVIHHIPPRDKHESRYYGSNGLSWYQQGFYRLLSYRADQLGRAPSQPGRALDYLIFPARIRRLVHEVELWRGHRNWYRSKGIPWKRGWLLYGPPGTGKTALARAFAEDLNLPIYVFNLAELGNHELLDAWRQMQATVPCLALIEDIDNIFHGRNNVARRDSLMAIVMADKKRDQDDENKNRPFVPLTFDCLLNCLDGVEKSDGVFTIITTNDITKIDPALGQPRRLPDGTLEFISTRPGRIDKAVELSFMEAEDKKRMAKRILSDYRGECEAMLAFIDRHPDLQETPAQFQERCAQIALKCFWSDEGLTSPERPIGSLRSPTGDDAAHAGGCRDAFRRGVRTEQDA